MIYFFLQINSHFLYFLSLVSIQTTERQMMETHSTRRTTAGAGPGGSGLVGRGADAGTAHDHRAVWNGVAATVVLPIQDQDVLVDWDWVQVACVFVTRVQTGTEGAGALGLPDGGGDLVLHRGRPDQSEKSHDSNWFQTRLINGSILNYKNSWWIIDSVNLLNLINSLIDHNLFAQFRLILFLCFHII